MCGEICLFFSTPVLKILAFCRKRLILAAVCGMKERIHLMGRVTVVQAIVWGDGCSRLFQHCFSILEIHQFPQLLIKG